MSEFAEKARTLGVLRHRGRSKAEVKVNEDTGRVAGYEREHWDDSRDAFAAPEPVAMGLTKKGG
jgi:hypothetical protein